MSAKFYAILTDLGAAKLANATALGTSLEITTMAVGDGGGAVPTPTASQTALIGEKRRAPLNSINIDPNNPNQIITEQIIPEDVGGWWIREIGLFDKDGVLIAVANCPDTYKPQLSEGSGRTQAVRMIIIVSNTAAVTLKIDPSVVLATRKYVDDSSSALEARMNTALTTHQNSRNHPSATATEKGFVKLNAAINSTSTTDAATPSAVKLAYDLAFESSKDASSRLSKSENLSDLEDVSEALINLGLGEAAKLSAATGGLAAAGWARIPLLMWGEERSLIIQWSGILSMPIASETSMSTRTWAFPIAFPTTCAGVFPVMARTTTYTPRYTPLCCAGTPTNTLVLLGCGYYASASEITAFAIGY